VVRLPGGGIALWIEMDRRSSSFCGEDRADHELPVRAQGARAALPVARALLVLPEPVHVNLSPSGAARTFVVGNPVVPDPRVVVVHRLGKLCVSEAQGGRKDAEVVLPPPLKEAC
jgi:hypothetical protein